MYDAFDFKDRSLRHTWRRVRTSVPSESELSKAAIIVHAFRSKLKLQDVSNLVSIHKTCLE